MKNKPPFFLLIFISLFLSCHSSNNQQKICKKWQEFEMHNLLINQVYENQQLIIDTLGSHTSAAENFQIYGTKDIIGLKKQLQQKLDSTKIIQQQIIKQTWFDFKTNGLVYLHSDEGLDSADWYLEEDTVLVFDEIKLKGAGSILRMHIVELKDSLLKLNYQEDGSSSTTVFQPAKN